MPESKNDTASTATANVDFVKRVSRMNRGKVRAKQYQNLFEEESQKYARKVKKAQDSQKVIKIEDVAGTGKPFSMKTYRPFFCYLRSNKNLVSSLEIPEKGRRNVYQRSIKFKYVTQKERKQMGYRAEQYPTIGTGIVNLLDEQIPIEMIHPYDVNDILMLMDYLLELSAKKSVFDIEATIYRRSKREIELPLLYEKAEKEFAEQSNHHWFIFDAADIAIHFIWSIEKAMDILHILEKSKILFHSQFNLKHESTDKAQVFDSCHLNLVSPSDKERYDEIQAQLFEDVKNEKNIPEEYREQVAENILVTKIDDKRIIDRALAQFKRQNAEGPKKSNTAAPQLIVFPSSVSAEDAGNGTPIALLPAAKDAESQVVADNETDVSELELKTANEQIAEDTVKAPNDISLLIGQAIKSVTQLTNIVKKYEEQNKKLEQKVEHLQSELDMERQKAHNIKSDLENVKSNLGKEISQLKDELAQEKDKVAKAKQDVTAIHKTVELMDASRKQKSEELAATRKKLRSTKAAYDKFIQGYEIKAQDELTYLEGTVMSKISEMNSFHEYQFRDPEFMKQYQTSIMKLIRQAVNSLSNFAADDTVPNLLK